MANAMKPVVACVALAVSAALPAQADDLVIFSAAAVRPGLIAVPPLVEKASGDRVTVSFGNATAISNKVAGGERVDVVILPPKQIDELTRKGLLLEAGRGDLGVVRLGIAMRAGSAKTPVATSDALKQALLSAPSFGMPDPAGGSTSALYLVKLLQQLGITEQMKARTKYFPDGTKALQAIAKGELALTIVPVTSIHATPGVELLGPLPEALQLKTVYAAALAKAAPSPPAAERLLKTLKSPEVAALLRSKGIDPP